MMSANQAAEKESCPIQKEFHTENMPGSLRLVKSPII
jgi:hypothetical protein